MEWLAAGWSACPLAPAACRRLDNGVERATLLSRPIGVVVMKTVNQSEAMKSRLTAAWIVAGALVLGAPVTSRAINAAAPTAGAVNQDAPAAQNAPVARFSPGVADIVKMVDAKVDPEVIKTYIQHSPTAYNPSATEIIALKDHGVGPEILTAMLQHGAEVRAQAMRAASAAANAPAPQAASGAVNPYAPAYDYSAQAGLSELTATPTPIRRMRIPRTLTTIRATTTADTIMALTGRGTGRRSASAITHLAATAATRTALAVTVIPIITAVTATAITMGVTVTMAVVTTGARCLQRGPRLLRGPTATTADAAITVARATTMVPARRPLPTAVVTAGFRSFGGAGRPATFGGSSGGFRTAGGFSGHAASFSGRGGGFGGRWWRGLRRPWGWRSRRVADTAEQSAS